MRIDLLSGPERLLNALSDLDLNWWPFLRFRPEKAQRFTKAATIYYSSLLIAGLTIGGLLAPMIVFALNSFLVAHGLMNPLKYTPALRGRIRHGIFSMTVTVFPPFGILVLLLFRWAWNRRAQRLSQVPTPAPVDSDTWPPPPQVPQLR